MIEVRRGDDVHLAVRIKFSQKYGQSHRVRAAGQGDHDAGVSAEQRVLANKLPDALEHGMGWRAGEAGRAEVLGGQDLTRPSCPSRLPPFPPENGAGGRTRTVDLALMRRPL